MKFKLCKHETGSHLWEAASGRTVGYASQLTETAEVERCPLHQEEPTLTDGSPDHAYSDSVYGRDANE